MNTNCCTLGGSGPACNDLGFLEDDYFADLRFKRQSPMATAANTLQQFGETVSLLISIPFVLAFSFLIGMVRGLMPLFVLWFNMWRMIMRPALAIISDVFWAMTHNYTHRVILKKVDGNAPFDDSAPSAALFAVATSSKPSRVAYEQV